MINIHQLQSNQVIARLGAAFFILGFEVGRFVVYYWLTSSAVLTVLWTIVDIGAAQPQILAIHSLRFSILAASLAILWWLPGFIRRRWDERPKISA